MKPNPSVQAKCDQCGVIQQVVWGKYGAEFPCFACDAAPINLTRTSQ